MYSRGDIDGGFGAVFAPPSGPGFIPFPSESADGIPDLDQITQELRLASDTDGKLDWLVGFYYFDEDLRAETFELQQPRPRQPARRLRLPEPGRQVVGAVRLARLRAERRLELQGRRALHDRREGLLGRAPRSDVPVAHRGADHGVDRRRPRHLGPFRDAEGERRGQRLRPRRHRLPRAVDPGPHPLLPRLRGRYEPGDELRLDRRRGGDPLDRDRPEERAAGPQAPLEPRRLPVRGRRPAARRRGRPASTPPRCSTPTRPTATASRPTSTGRLPAPG